MMILPTIFATSFIIALSGALMPGPLLTVTIAESARRGAYAGPMVIFGHGILEMAVVVVLLSGLAPLLLKDTVFIAIAFSGGLILFWMAFSMFRELPGLRLQCEVNGDRQRNLLAAGIVLSAANPYFIIWWASVGFGYIIYSAKFGLVGVVTFFLGHILADMAWYSLVSFGVCRGRHFLTESGYRWICGGCAVLLCLFGGYFLFSGLQRML